jgi:hypothetical protein
VMRRGNERRDRTAAATSALAGELERSGAVCPAPDLAEPDPVTAAIRDLPKLEQEITTSLAAEISESENQPESVIDRA